MMKKFTITLVLILGIFIAHSNPFGSTLIVTSHENSLIRIAVDHGHLGAAKAKIKLYDLSQGNHWIKIVRHNAYPGGQHKQLIYKGSIHISPNTITKAVVNRFGNFKVQTVKPLFNSGYSSNSFNNICGFNNCGLSAGHAGLCSTSLQPCGFNGCGFTHGHSGIHGNYNSSCGTFYSQSYTGYGQGNWNNQGFGYGSQIMSNGQFRILIRTLRDQTFDNTRMQIAKQVISQNYFSTIQVSELIRIFTFDSNRLEIAKFAYAHTIDKENYYSLSNAFDFNSSVNKLMNFIGKA